MHPAIALALLAVAGVLATRLPRPVLPGSVPQAAFNALALVFMGVLLGPIAGILDSGLLRALTPLTGLVVGWVGASEGARFTPRLLIRVRDSSWRRVAAVTAGTIAAVSVAAWLAAGRNPQLAAWHPAGPVALALGTIAAVTTRQPRYRTAGVQLSIALLCALMAFMLTRPLAHFSGLKGLVVWLGLNGVAMGMVGLCTALVSARARNDAEFALGILAFTSLAAGVGVATGFSPFLLCAGAAAVAAWQLDRAGRSGLRAIVTRPVPGLHGLVWVLLGVFASVPRWWIIPAAVALAVLRAAVWLAGRRFDTRPPARYTPDALGPVLGLNFMLSSDPALGLAGGVVTTIIVLLVASMAAAPWLEHVHPPSARLTPDAVTTELRC